MNDSTKKKIKESLRLTKLKRQTQRCKSVELKIDYSNLNKQQKEFLKMFFVEAKWLYNFILSQDNIFKLDYKISTVVILKNKCQVRKQLRYLLAKNKQDILNLIRQNITALSKLKNKGCKVGKLKFKSSYNCIGLSQYGHTHKITGNNRIKINGIKKPIIVYGLNQVKNNYEIANAKLIQKASGYYIKLVCYELKSQSERKGEDIGIDFGIKNNFTLSNGKVINVISIEETERLKLLQKKMQRQLKSSNNRYKTKTKIQKEYEKITNRKNDAANKIINYLLTNYNRIYIQDEQLSDWQKNYKKVQYNCLGRVKFKLKRSNNTFVINKYCASTKLCYCCGKINKINLSQRIYECSCGLKEDRDLKAAKTIKYLGQQQQQYNVPMDYRDVKFVENITSTLTIGSPFVNISYIQ